MPSNANKYDRNYYHAVVEYNIGKYNIYCQLDHSYIYIRRQYCKYLAKMLTELLAILLDFFHETFFTLWNADI